MFCTCIPVKDVIDAIILFSVLHTVRVLYKELLIVYILVITVKTAEYIKIGKVAHLKFDFPNFVIIS